MEAVSPIVVETFTFPPSAKPPIADRTLFLAGAGVRGLEIEGRFIKFTAIGLYADTDAVPFLASRWKGKSPEELNDSEEFICDFISGPFQKATRVSMMMPLTGEQYSTKVVENCIAIWESRGIFTDAEERDVERFLAVFREEKFLPGQSIVFTHLPKGSLAISFASHDFMATEPRIIIDNRLLSEAIVASIIGKDGVSPLARQSLATRLSKFMNEGIKFSDPKIASSLSSMSVEGYTFPATVIPPSSISTLFLCGAGERGIVIEGKMIKFTSIGVYLEENLLNSLATKWKGKPADDLNDSEEFFTTIITAPFEKFVRVTMILPLSGQQYSEKVAENCVAIWKSMGCFSDEEEKAVEMFLDGFKNESFPPGSSILFHLLPRGSLAIAFAKHDVVPEGISFAIDNKLLSQAVLGSIIGKNGVSPATRKSIADRLHDLFLRQS